METLTEEQDIKERWRKYFEELLNEENPYEVQEEEKVGPVEDITETEIKSMLKKMMKGKHQKVNQIMQEEERGEKDRSADTKRGKRDKTKRREEKMKGKIERLILQ